MLELHSDADGRREAVPAEPDSGGGTPPKQESQSLPSDEELSAWPGDLADEIPDDDSYTPDDLSPDVPEEAERPRRENNPEPKSLYVNPLDDEGVPAPFFLNCRKGKRTIKPSWRSKRYLKPEERLLILDIWNRSGLPAGDVAPLVGVSKHTLYSWKKRFEEEGPEGLLDKKRGARNGSKLPEVTKRTILMIKEANPDYGVHRISDMMARGPALPASPGAVSRVLHEAGYVTEHVQTVPHKPKVRRFERARPNQMWQTDLFTFTLKRTNRRVYLVVFLDDNSRFITTFGLNGSATTAMVIETLENGIASYGVPEEVLTDNGPQFRTWRGKSAFTKECEHRGIKQIVARPKHPQTLGKVERFWGTLWRECVRAAVFVDVNDARARIGQFIDHYNFQRVHSGIDGLVPADRFFGAQQEVLETLKARVAANALAIARDGEPKVPFYVTGNVNGQAFSVHAQGERIMLKREGEENPQEIDLTALPRKLPEAELVEDVLPNADAAAEPDTSPDEDPTDADDEELAPMATERVQQIVGNLTSED